MSALIKPAKFVIKGPRLLPILLILDTSTSMQGERIAALNRAVRDMIEQCSKYCTRDTAIAVGVLAFNNSVTQILLNGESSFAIASHAKWTDLSADGGTFLNLALDEAKALIDNPNTLPPNCYRPLVVLLTDGEPFPGWEEPMKRFCTEGRSGKCDRLAVMVGEERNLHPLEKFVEGTSNPVLRAKDPINLERFFKLVTLTVTTRLVSRTPDVVVSLNPEKAQQRIDIGKDVAPESSVDDDDDDDLFLF